jgi:hypothetical protein
MGDDTDNQRTRLALDKGREGRFEVSVSPRFHNNAIGGRPSIAPERFMRCARQRCGCDNYDLA